MTRRGGGARNSVPGRTQADLEPYRTQDERPDYQGGRVQDEQEGERRDVTEAREIVEESRKKDRLNP
jgi:hypothetical protein